MIEPDCIAIERLDRYEMFHQSLSLDEQADLDCFVKFVCDLMRRRAGYARFGPRMAKELIMALVDFVDQHPLKGA